MHRGAWANRSQSLNARLRQCSISVQHLHTIHVDRRQEWILPHVPNPKCKGTQDPCVISIHYWNVAESLPTHLRSENADWPTKVSCIKTGIFHMNHLDPEATVQQMIIKGHQNNDWTNYQKSSLCSSKHYFRTICWWNRCLIFVFYFSDVG